MELLRLFSRGRRLCNKSTAYAIEYVVDCDPNRGGGTACPEYSQNAVRGQFLLL